MRQRYTKEYLEPIVASCTSWVEVCTAVGIKVMTGAQTHLTNVAKRFSISTEHFVKKTNKGRTFPKKRPITDYFKIGFVNRQMLRKRLIFEGFKKEECEWCHRTHWLGEPIGLELDHKNSNPIDNNLENLQILCGNCHTIKTRRDRNFRVMSGCLGMTAPKEAMKGTPQTTHIQKGGKYAEIKSSQRKVPRVG